MSMTDYFSKLNKIEKHIVKDSVGGFVEQYYTGIDFQGLVVKKGTQEQLVGAVRGKVAEQYTLHTYANIPLQKDDIIAYVEVGKTKYIRISSDVHLNPDKSLQTEWGSFDAETYNPAGSIV